LWLRVVAVEDLIGARAQALEDFVLAQDYQ
jgi:hypothetical protein